MEHKPTHKMVVLAISTAVRNPNQSGTRRGVRTTKRSFGKGYNPQARDSHPKCHESFQQEMLPLENEIDLALSRDYNERYRVPEAIYRHM